MLLLKYKSTELMMAGLTVQCKLNLPCHNLKLNPDTQYCLYATLYPLTGSITRLNPTMD